MLENGAPPLVPHSEVPLHVRPPCLNVPLHHLPLHLGYCSLVRFLGMDYLSPVPFPFACYSVALRGLFGVESLLPLSIHS